MPIYAYKCSTCAHERDVLQKISDDPLTVCPACNAPTFAKQVTAAGFQLKGSGWYVTDFRDGNKKADKKAEAKSDAAPTTDSTVAAAKAESTSESKPDTKPDAKADSKSESRVETKAAIPSTGT
jgi:putative FmdB family regulatory protein